MRHPAHQHTVLRRKTDLQVRQAAARTLRRRTRAHTPQISEHMPALAPSGPWFTRISVCALLFARADACTPPRTQPPRLALLLWAACLAAAPRPNAAAFKCCTADNMAAPSCAAVTTPNDPVVCAAMGDLWQAFGGAAGLSRNLGSAVGAAFGCPTSSCTPTPPPNVWASAATTNWGLAASGVPQDYCSFDGSPPGPPNPALTGYLVSAITCPSGYQAVVATGDPAILPVPPPAPYFGFWAVNVGLTACSSNTLVLNAPTTCTLTLQPAQRIAIGVCSGSCVAQTGYTGDITSLPTSNAGQTFTNLDAVWPLTITDASSNALTLLNTSNSNMAGTYYYYTHPTIRGYVNKYAR